MPAPPGRIPPMRCWSPAPRSSVRAGWATPSIWNGRRARDLGLRVFVGKQCRHRLLDRVDPAGFAALAERAVAMAKVVPEDPYSGLADGGAVRGCRALDLGDPAEPTAEQLIARASVAEDAARAVPGVTNCEGAEAGFGRAEIVLVTSAGFAGSYVRTSHSVSATALAGSGTAMQRDYDYSSHGASVRPGGRRRRSAIPPARRPWRG